MNWFARLIYGALVWRERQHAKAGRKPGKQHKPKGKNEHLRIGSRGETLAYWHLRQAGYVIVARNRRPHSKWGELDMIGWDGSTLAFIEVKTRTGNAAGPPETVVSRRQQQRIVRSAKGYIKQMKRKPASFRFDVAGVRWDPVAGYKVHVVKDAYQV
ncbi:MAG TPA: YraN family protein [Terriglobia bacterium]|nr:YraN family protein [Terriglobia bacterium]